ncbi:hypothetical protein D3C81_736930 [compost metagenome]
MSTIQKSLLVDGGQNVPHTLNIAVLKRDIRIIKISPVSDRFGQLSPLFLIFKDTVFTLLDEFFNPIILDFLLARNSKLLLHTKFHRQTMGIPASFADNTVTVHGLITTNKVLDHTAKHMPDMWSSVCSRRSLVEYVVRSSCPILNTLTECILTIPFSQDPFLPRTGFFFHIHLLHLLQPSFLQRKIMV